MTKRGLPFMRMDTMSGRYFIVQSQNPERVVRKLRQRFKDMRFTPQEGTFKVLATYVDKSKEVTDSRAQEIENFIERVQNDQ